MGVQVMIRAVIFDVGGVVTKDFNGFGILAKKLNIDLDLIITVWNKYKLDIHEHKSTIENFLKIVKEQAKIDADIISTWEKIYYDNLDIDGDVLKIIEKLKGRYKLAVISNTADLHAKLIRKKGVYSHFDKVFLSYEIKIAKPQKGIFIHALKELKLNPADCVFIDNNIKNLSTAKNLGFATINFQNAKQLAGDLKSFGVAL
ncbi:MAG: HAD family phosphatase [DPANN group archaeon]|nr:HAD family phosphatase [DPANN group archaeon]